MFEKGRLPLCRLQALLCTGELTKDVEGVFGICQLGTDLGLPKVGTLLMSDYDGCPSSEYVEMQIV